VTPTFFTSREKFRAWLEKHHSKTPELWIGFYKKDSGRRGITYKDALDEALCFGWIDGVRKRLNDDAFVQRFTPRKAKSYWSAVNTKRAHELIKAKRMAPPGLDAFGRRDASVTRRYSFERDSPSFSAAQLKEFRANRAAWEFFQAQPPYYRRLLTFYVVSAKREETRAKRLARLIGDSAAGRRIGLMTSNEDRAAGKPSTRRKATASTT
jgi:uncharacterized protein YdeI (YjbR/CyaY-like superfamily)